LEAYSSYQSTIDNSVDTKYAYVQGTYNSIFRQAFMFIKSRSINSLHHAHDASLAIVIDKCLNNIFPGYAVGNKFNQERYKKFIEQYFGIDEKVDNSYEQYLNTLNIFRKMYTFAFNENFDDSNSLVNEIKENYPRISYKVERKVTGKLFDATLQRPIGINNVTIAELEQIAKLQGLNLGELKGVDSIKQYLSIELGEDNLDKMIRENSSNLLQILQVSNDKRAMDTVNCCATDFYKVKSKKKNGTYSVKHYAIHIPLAIVDSNGNIDNERYKLLVKKHYGAMDLFDDEDNLKEYLFRFRARKNDMIYDTFTNEIKLNNFGSIANKKLEYKPIFFSSYSSEINKFNTLKRAFSPLYKRKEKLTEKQYDELNLLLIESGYITPDEKFAFASVFKNILKSDASNNEKLFQVVNKINYSKFLGAPTALGQWSSTANPLVFDKNNDDIQYVKVETSPLGVRVKKVDDKLFISGKHKKIKNNKQFSWNVLL
ncbi:MAG: hypothetical protein ACK5NF_07775, partial [Bacilli bacterium]